MTSTTKISSKFNSNLGLQARASMSLKAKVLIHPEERNSRDVGKIRHPMKVYQY
jgi:hypothetical protein